MHVVKDFPGQTADPKMSHGPYTSFPRGWYRVAWSSKIKKKRITKLHYFGRDLIAFRTETGEAVVLDAHCPHLGAHIGFGGKVVGSQVECPYHGWRFNAQGACVAVPYSKRPCPKVAIKSWPILDRNGCLYVYHDPLNRTPPNEVSIFPEIISSEWSPFRIFQWDLKVHPFELIENGVDLSHFKFLHGFEEALKLESIQMNDEDFETVTRGLKRVPFKTLETIVKTRYIGPGITYMNVSGTWDIMVTSHVTPIDEKLSSVALQYCFRKSKMPAINWIKELILAQSLYGTFTPDFKIWANRYYIEEAPVVPEDGPIHKVRRWCTRFLEEATPISYEKTKHNLPHKSK